MLNNSEQAETNQTKAENTQKMRRNQILTMNNIRNDKAESDELREHVYDYENETTVLMYPI
jgi:hypothetical protein